MLYTIYASNLSTADVGIGLAITGISYTTYYCLTGTLPTNQMPHLMTGLAYVLFQQHRPRNPIDIERLRSAIETSSLSELNRIRKNNPKGFGEIGKTPVFTHLSLSTRHTANGGVYLNNVFGPNSTMTELALNVNEPTVISWLIQKVGYDKQACHWALSSEQTDGVATLFQTKAYQDHMQEALAFCIESLQMKAHQTKEQQLANRLFVAELNNFKELIRHASASDLASFTEKCSTVLTEPNSNISEAYQMVMEEKNRLNSNISSFIV